MTDRSVNNISETMAPRSEEDFKTIRSNRKAAIVDAAMELFAEHGFHGASMNLLAKKAGISKGLVYNYFSNKEELIKEVIQQGTEKMFGSFVLPAGTFTSKDIESLIDQNFDLLDESPRYWQLYFSVIMQPGVMNLAMESIMNILTPLMEKLGTYFKNKGFKEFEKEAYFIGSLLDGISLNYLYNKEIYPRDYAIKRIKEILNLKTNT